MPNNFRSEGMYNRNSFKRIMCFYWIKNSIFYEIKIIVFQFTQRATEKRSECHAWHACRRLPTLALDYPSIFWESEDDMKHLIPNSRSRETESRTLDLENAENTYVQQTTVCVCVCVCVRQKIPLR